MKAKLIIAMIFAVGLLPLDADSTLKAFAADSEADFNGDILSSGPYIQGVAVFRFAEPSGEKKTIVKVVVNKNAELTIGIIPGLDRSSQG